MNKRKIFFDRAQLEENHKGVEDLLPSTIDEFLTYISEMVTTVEKALQEKRMDDLTMATHSLKGAMASVCAEPLKEIAFRMEKLSRENQIAEIKPHLEELQSGLDILKVNLETYKQELQKND